MSISKTRQKLVDVARQLFAKNGLENTTMNDIALQSGKGRRTLYTYFKSKEEIYYAVIEGELERLSDKLDEVAARKIRPQDKIIELIYTHLSMIRETVVRNGNLRAEFFRNIWMVEKVRKHFDDAEIELFRKVFPLCRLTLANVFIKIQISVSHSLQKITKQIATYGKLHEIMAQRYNLFFK